MTQKNLINFDPDTDTDIDIPPEYWNIEKYRATLGHKVNHSFKKANTVYGRAIHPRFGPILTVFATKDIKKGEEILVDYEYGYDSVVDLWYAKLYEDEMGKPFPGKNILNESNPEDIFYVSYNLFQHL